MSARLQGPAERYAPCAVWSIAGTRYRVIDRATGRYLPTVPREYWSRENAQLTARALTRGKSRNGLESVAEVLS